MQPITANYIEEGDGWTVVVIGLERELCAQAPGLVAARDRADQLVDTLEDEPENRAVVHVMNGSALEFTARYLEVRLAVPAEEEPARAGATDKPDGAVEGAVDGAVDGNVLPGLPAELDSAGLATDGEATADGVAATDGETAADGVAIGQAGDNEEPDAQASGEPVSA